MEVLWLIVLPVIAVIVVRYFEYWVQRLYVRNKYEWLEVLNHYEWKEAEIIERMMQELKKTNVELTSLMQKDFPKLIEEGLVEVRIGLRMHPMHEQIINFPVVEFKLTMAGSYTKAHRNKDKRSISGVFQPTASGFISQIAGFLRFFLF